MPGKLTREKVTQYRAEAAADLRLARRTEQHAWVDSLRKRIEFLDEYWSRHFGPREEGQSYLDVKVPPTQF